MGICFQLLVATRLALLASVPFLAQAAIAAPVPADRLWQKKLTGYVSDIAVSGNGQAILVATLPNYDDVNGARRNYLSYFDRKGRQRWRKEMTSGVKSLALSNDGTLAIVTTHDDRIQAFNAGGKSLWSIEGSCKPIILSRSRKMVCYHDEDAEPRVAFDLYNEKGLKLGSAPAETDSMALRVSNDEREIAVGLTRGELVLYSADQLKPLWRARVRGEIVDIGISRGREPRVAAVYSRRGAPRMALLDSHGATLVDQALGFHPDQVEFAPRDPSRILVYGNGDPGQSVALLALEGKVLRQKWKTGEPAPANYTQSMYMAGRAGLLVGFEDERARGRQGEIRSYGLDGKLRWTLPVAASEAACLYAESYAPASGLLAAASDDGTLSLYQVRAVSEAGRKAGIREARRRKRGVGNPAHEQ